MAKKNGTKDRILKMTEEDVLEFISKLWAMLIWGNKQYVVDQMISDNGFEKFKQELSELLWGSTGIEARWDRAMKNIKHMGPAMYSELLCHVHPDDCMVWNRRAYAGLNYLGVPKLPKYNYQLTGKRYKELSSIGKLIATEMKEVGFPDTTLLAVDYFIWEELQVEDNLSKIFTGKGTKEEKLPDGLEELAGDKEQFIHNEIRDSIMRIGEMLGFKAFTEKKVADGSVVDTVWEVTIGNMGRAIYVFEVQTKGNIDSLMMNLLKSKNNPAVQGIVAVSDQKQIEKIRKHSATVRGLENLKFWNYKEVIKVHQSLEFVNQSINNLKLVPDGFG
ncbi:MAG: hypothetical protein MI974_26920 [Chitinophagales bacterium]|nr:hypothetical protein [Chitinophagales bacterium]